MVGSDQIESPRTNVPKSMGNAKKLKSREYPAVNLRQAVEFARRIYEKDRWNEVPAAVSVRHLGYSGLHGKSRSALSALKKYGLVEYLSSGENLRIKLSDRSKRIFTPVREDETSEAIWEALSLPQINAEVLEKYPDWELPSQETFANVLERDFRMQHGAAQSYIADLCASLEFARSYKRNEEPTNSQDEDVLRPIPESNSGFTQRLSNSQAEVSVGTIRVQMPSSPTYMTLPEKLEPKDAKRILKWIETVVTPTIKFAASDDDNGIGPTEEI